MKQGEGLRSVGSATPGGSITVEIGPNDSTVEVEVAGSDGTTSHSVTPGKAATIPMPNVLPGTVLFVTVGTGLRARVIEVTIIAPSP